MTGLTRAQMRRAAREAGRRAGLKQAADFLRRAVDQPTYAGEVERLVTHDWTGLGWRRRANAKAKAHASAHGGEP